MEFNYSCINFTLSEFGTALKLDTLYLPVMDFSEI